MYGLIAALIPPAITSATIILVACWVNTTIRKKQQGSSLLAGYLKHIHETVNRMIEDIFGAKCMMECTALFVALSNEVTHLEQLHEHLAGHPDNTMRMSKLKRSVFELKKRMTGNGVVPTGADLAVARQSANEVRKRCLDVSLAILQTR